MSLTQLGLQEEVVLLMNLTQSDLQKQVVLLISFLQLQCNLNQFSQEHQLQHQQLNLHQPLLLQKPHLQLFRLLFRW